MAGRGHETYVPSTIVERVRRKMPRIRGIGELDWLSFDHRTEKIFPGLLRDQINTTEGKEITLCLVLDKSTYSTDREESIHIHPDGISHCLSFPAHENSKEHISLDSIPSELVVAFRRLARINQWHIGLYADGEKKRINIYIRMREPVDRATKFIESLTGKLNNLV